MALSMLFFSSLTALRAGHLLHHTTNRHEDATEVYVTGRAPYLSYYIEILGGFYLLAEWLAPYLCQLPQTLIQQILRNAHQKYPHKQATVNALLRLIQFISEVKKNAYRGRIELTRINHRLTGLPTPSAAIFWLFYAARYIGIILQQHATL